MNKHITVENTRTCWSL